MKWWVRVGFASWHERESSAIKVRKIEVVFGSLNNPDENRSLPVKNASGYLDLTKE
jgi:hypothetical protein